MLRKDEELEVQAQAVRKREQEVEAENKKHYDEIMEDWEKERKRWWGERHQQEEQLEA